MRFLVHLNTKEYPIFITNKFNTFFSPKIFSLNFDPFLRGNTIPFSGMKSSVVYSLHKPYPKTYSVKAYHSNVVESAQIPPPHADGHYIAVSLEELSSVQHTKRHLGMRTADCLAVVFCFENKDFFMGAVTHAGWRGLSSGILQNTLARLQLQCDKFSISREVFMSSLRIHIAPAIFGVSYECGLDVKEAFLKHGRTLFTNHPGMDKYLGLYHELIDIRSDKDLVIETKKFALSNKMQEQKIFPDLQLLAALECVVSGVNQGNIEILRENTYSHPALFSFREATHTKSDKSLRQWTHLRFPLIKKGKSLF